MLQPLDTAGTSHMTSLHWQTSLKTQICYAHCTPGKTSTSIDTGLCLGDNYSLTWRPYIRDINDIKEDHLLQSNVFLFRLSSVDD